MGAGLFLEMSLARCPSQDLQAELAAACVIGAKRLIVLCLTACRDAIHISLLRCQRALTRAGLLNMFSLAGGHQCTYYIHCVNNHDACGKSGKKVALSQQLKH